MPASSAPTSPQASGLSASSLCLSASPTSALATSARSFPSARPWSGKRRQDQGALTTRAAPSTICSRSSRSELPRRHSHKNFGMRIDHLLVTAPLNQQRRAWLIKWLGVFFLPVQKDDREWRRTGLNF